MEGRAAAQDRQWSERGQRQLIVVLGVRCWFLVEVAAARRRQNVAAATMTTLVVRLGGGLDARRRGAVEREM
ncbi:UNVERIFIED_CONTAM: hypothetical protein Sradi_4423900 [Sesamum radiatum]|uniref:Uncharacterized protein n=1 Tax=Sesamum radiatum TaxID=300843 RepID=A0AAW2NTU3_SESRA